ncbi:hypothetical protein [Clavibacter michiganensis]|uniref:Uncharacterized protein n=2 Tax=Clavibacter michiganensis TaxID=28447 RepID=A0A251YDP4_9MICO|nr:hypothetical protein [Clavibacter michiganensis]AJW79892.1 membrane protein [Clavibacter michiganensis subsp. insidiosus]AWF97486.1 hypothetical protein BEH61_03105 [Clavibacter michiganensis subsp. insidiosus]AWG02423.1 hypothetical protein BEH62_12550 [Clavibacter michiganensis subsp. insidiosus]OQJ59130.1 hypothetical protein B5P21_03840 [Clavibacter michiganensis subsp. insidiosus]OUE22239.1 hypothetical protein BFL34_00283 [Clavibacter michiganensis]
MTSPLRSLVPVWLAAAVGAVVVAVAVGPDAAPRWFPLVLATCVVATFVIQLSLPRKTGFVDRAVGSVVGAVLVLAAATAVVLLVPVAA